MWGRLPTLRQRLAGLRLPGTRRRRRAGTLRHRRLACEPLEPRTVLSVILGGDVLELGINDDGSLITAPEYQDGVGARLNGVELIAWGSPWAPIVVSANGMMHLNAGAMGWPSAFAATVTDTSSGGTLAALVEGTVTPGLELERTISFASDSSLIRMTITLTNTGSTALENVAFMEAVDPDPGWPFGLTYRTYNDVVPEGDFALAHIVQDGSPTLTFGMGSADPRATVSVESWAPDPFQTIDSPNDPDGTFFDHHLHVAFDFGTLAPGESVSAEYGMVLAGTPTEAEELYQGTGNAPPVGADDSYAVDEDNTLTVAAAAGVLLNDTDPDGDPLTAVSVTDPAHGSLTFNPDGSFTYVPDADFYGTDAFVYEVSDGQGGTATAGVTITVNPVIDAVIDVHPGGGSVNLRSNGVLRVAVLTTSTADGEPEDFDATSLAALDLDSIEFGDSRPDYERVSPRRAIVEDVDGDGDLDLVLHFSMREIRDTGALDADSVDAVLTAETGGAAIGVDLIGHDPVQVKAPKEHMKAAKGKAKSGK